ncbi:MAG: hypothetical protein JST00_11980 [Deltaproteobacteria bacterium]|nr:hypothetical protein [Deltaproteobacteria bacterium]
MSARREAVATSVTENPDGSRTMSMTFEAGAAIRPVDAAVVRAFDAALARLGGEVMHAIELRVGEVWPCNGAITCLPFKSEAHAAMPSTELCALLTARDPVLPTIATPRGDVEVRRLVGLHQDELDRIETWSSEGSSRSISTSIRSCSRICVARAR